MESMLSIIASVVSIVATILAVISACKSYKNKRESETIKIELLQILEQTTTNSIYSNSGVAVQTQGDGDIHVQN